MSNLKSKLIPSMFNSFMVDLPSPINLNYMYNMGSMLGLCLIIQLVTGMFLASYYSPTMDLAFLSVQHIVKQVFWGYSLSTMHAVGAGLFFMFMYMHMGKAMYYGSYMGSTSLWISGVMMFFLLMATGFLGYTLPWGQMSLWGAVVMTSFFSAIPYIGGDMTKWMWGSFSVGDTTLHSFFTLHFLLPFLLAGLVIIHFVLLHEGGSSNPLGMSGGMDKMSFSPYFIVKDALGYMIFGLMMCMFVYYYPSLMGHDSNFMEANPLVTPAHMVPEFYFLPFYTMLSAIPNKLGGVMAMMSGVFVLFTLPIMNTSMLVPSSNSPIYSVIVWMFFMNFLFLCYFGSETTGLMLMSMSVMYYFSFFMMLVPLSGYIENKMMLS